MFIFAGAERFPDGGLFLKSLLNGLFSFIVQRLNSQVCGSKGRTVAYYLGYFLCNIKQAVFLKCDTKFGEFRERWARCQDAAAHCSSVKAKEDVADSVAEKRGDGMLNRRETLSCFSEFNRNFLSWFSSLLAPPAAWLERCFQTDGL